MKSKVAIAVLLGIISTSAVAQDQFGIGVILGEPTGLSLKYWLDDEHAVDGGVAWSFSENDSFHLHADYLIHNFEWLDLDESPGKLPVYYGLGARLKFKDDDGRGDNKDHTMFGIRVPLGISYIFADAPFDVFAEVVPILDLSPDVELDIAAAVGLRIYLK